MTLNDLLARYYAWLEDHRAPKTVQIYKTALKPIGTAFGERDVVDIAPDDIENCLAKVTRGKKPNTVIAYVVGFETFQSWAIKRKHLKEPIVAELEKPRGTRRERYPTAVEIEQIISKSTPAFAIAYRALVLCGARPSELAAAKIGDYDRGAGMIVLKEHKTKRTGKPRKIYIGKRLAALMAELIGDRTDPGESIFRRDDGKPWAAHSLGRYYRQSRRAAGLPDELHLYATRHYFISEICKHHPPAIAAALAGHSSTQTTEVYMHTDHEHLRKILDSM